MAKNGPENGVKMDNSLERPTLGPFFAILAPLKLGFSAFFP